MKKYLSGETLVMTFNNFMCFLVGLVFTVMSANSLSCDASLKPVLDLHQSEKGLVIVMKNEGLSDFDMANNFELGGSASTSPLRVVVKNKLGKEFEVKGVIGSRVPRNIISLNRGHMYGKEFSIDDLKFYFNIDSGDYDVRVIYNDRLAKDKSCRLVVNVESPWVNIKVP